MKVRRDKPKPPPIQVEVRGVKFPFVRVRSCDDDWDDDWLPYYETGTSYELGGPVERPRLRSVSPAAHRAMNHIRPRSVGFHRPKS